jgi:hypothetical protein
MGHVLQQTTKNLLAKGIKICEPNIEKNIEKQCELSEGKICKEVLNIERKPIEI